MKYLTLLLLAALSTTAMAQYDSDTDNGVVSLAGREGFTIQTTKGDFVFKPYMLVQTKFSGNYYDDEGLDKAYNQDNVANSGFSIPYAVLGFTGKVFGKVTYNLSINAAGSSVGAVLQQAWFDVQPNEKVGFRVGKFKTPFTHAYLTTLGETLLPSMPLSLTSTVILPYSLNAVTPSIGMGFDLGAEVHGKFGAFGYQVGIFNGTGGTVNSATKTLSDDWHIPSLLYAGRLTLMPKGVMPATQGSPRMLDTFRWMMAASASINVESESESTNDSRFGFEASMILHRLYLGGEFYYMNIGFTDRQKIDEKYNYLGGYLQAGYFVTDKWQIAARYELFDRNGTDANGYLNIPAVGFNYFFMHSKLKLQGMYQYVGRENHDTQLDRDNDNLSLATHSVQFMLQYSF